MKNVLMLIILFIAYVVKGQNGLNIENLKPITYQFQIQNGKMFGEGADFLLKEISKSQFTMLGEYHDSKRISEFTEALIPEIDKYDYKNLILEIGPISANVLDSTNEEIISYLKSLNQKYMLKDGDYTDIPIPFFDYIEDAQFLKKAKELNWNLIGVDQEYYNSFIMLSDIMFNNLSKIQQNESKDIYKSTSDSLKVFYNGDKDFSVSVKKSKTVKKFLESMSKNNKNSKIIDAFNKSIDIYYLNDTGRYFENNSDRINYMKTTLREEIENRKLDVSKEKLLIKMGQNHLAKGFSPLALYEVGNMLNELAEYHGNRSFNIGFITRFTSKRDKVVDLMDSENSYTKKLKDLRQMGMKDEWVVIDLRKLIKGHFYRPIKYRFNETIENLVKRYDVIIIPKIEVEPTLNYITN